MWCASCFAALISLLYIDSCVCVMASIEVLCCRWSIPSNACQRFWPRRGVPSNLRLCRITSDTQHLYIVLRSGHPQMPAPWGVLMVKVDVRDAVLCIQKLNLAIAATSGDLQGVAWSTWFPKMIYANIFGENHTKNSITNKIQKMRHKHAYKQKWNLFEKHAT